VQYLKNTQVSTAVDSSQHGNQQVSVLLTSAGVCKFASWFKQEVTMANIPSARDKWNIQWVLVSTLKASPKIVIQNTSWL